MAVQNNVLMQLMSQRKALNDSEWQIESIIRNLGCKVEVSSDIKRAAEILGHEIRMQTSTVQRAIDALEGDKNDSSRS